MKSQLLVVAFLIGAASMASACGSNNPPNRKPNGKTPAARNPSAPAPGPKPAEPSEEKKLETAATDADKKFKEAETAAKTAADALTKKTQDLTDLNTKKTNLEGKKTANTITADEQKELDGIDAQIADATKAKTAAEDADKKAKDAVTAAKTKKDAADKAVADFKKKAEDKKKLQDAVKTSEKAVKDAEAAAKTASDDVTTKTKAHKDLNDKKIALETEKANNNNMLDIAKQAQLDKLTTDVGTAKIAMDMAVMKKGTEDKAVTDAKKKLTDDKAALEAFIKANP